MKPEISTEGEQKARKSHFKVVSLKSKPVGKVNNFREETLQRTTKNRRQKVRTNRSTRRNGRTRRPSRKMWIPIQSEFCCGFDGLF
ncbi:hypothetical protein L596_026512 [Steinernema carpocapsae]|uniref:Uncharacterized protein n=1 Tax=Steinernema carpocapsae TaxID=34508 RepID=A0A4U5M1K6_STECR|nr:hypothetical protein L596_026512 [Steinernema carpocapsae]